MNKTFSKRNRFVRGFCDFRFVPTPKTRTVKPVETKIISPDPTYLLKLKRDVLADKAERQYGMKVKSKTTKQQMVDHIMETVA